jgi:hypothetical protein
VRVGLGQNEFSRDFRLSGNLDLDQSNLSATYLIHPRRTYMQTATLISLLMPIQSNTFH